MHEKLYEKLHEKLYEKLHEKLYEKLYGKLHFYSLIGFCCFKELPNLTWANTLLWRAKMRQIITYIPDLTERSYQIS